MMDRKIALDLLACSIRPVLLAHLEEAIALGKKKRLNKASGQESLFGDEEEDLHEARNLKLDAQVIAVFGVACENWKKSDKEARHRQQASGRIEVSSSEDQAFWDYHRKMGRAGR